MKNFNPDQTEVLTEAARRGSCFSEEGFKDEGEELDEAAMTSIGTERLALLT